jgi:hypothetical protein
VKTEIVLVCFDRNGYQIGQVMTQLGFIEDLPEGTHHVMVSSVTERRTS